MEKAYSPLLPMTQAAITRLHLGHVRNSLSEGYYCTGLDNEATSAINRPAHSYMVLYVLRETF